MHRLHSTITALMILVAPVSSHAQPVTDHHIHLRSEVVTEAGEKWQEAVPYNTDPADGKRWAHNSLRSEMEEAGIDRALVLSFAYMFSAPELDYENEHKRVREENDWIAAQAAASERLVAFCGIPPLADYALDEVDRCADKPSVRGIKLHLFNADVDLTDEEELAMIVDLIGHADDHGLYTVIHPQTRDSDYGVPQLQRFLEAVAPEVQQTALQMAHLGLNVPLTEEEVNEIDTLARTLDALDPDEERFFLDSSFAVVPPSLVDGDTEAFVRDANPRAGEAFRTLGLDRIVFGSDSNSPGQMEAHLQAFRHHSGLSAEDVETVLTNRFPAIQEEH